MNKKIILSIVLVLSLVMLFVGCTPKSNADDIIANGDFSNVGDGGLFTDWEYSIDESFKDADRNISSKGVEDGSSEDKGHGNYIILKTSKLGVNYLYQQVKLKKDVIYEISADIRVTTALKDEVNTSLGAWVGFVEDGSNLIKVKSTTANWSTKKIYVKSDVDKTLTFAFGIGHPSVTKSSGTAHFDNISLKAVDSAPEGVVPLSIKVENDVPKYSNPKSVAFVVVGAIIAVLMIALFMYTYRKNMSKDMISSNKMLSPMALFVYVMLGAFIIRFLLAIFTKGMVNELNALANVALKFNGGTKLNMIMPYAATNLPAGMLYLLYIINGLANLMAIKGAGFNILLRLPFILADLVAIYMIFSLVSKRQKEHTAIFVAGLYAILPSVIIASTGWGMAISLVGCLLIGMYYCMLNKNYIGVNALFVLSLLFSNLTLLVLPLVIAFLVNAFVKYDKERVKIGVSSLVALVAFYCISLPFFTATGKGNPFYMFKVMYKDLTMGSVLTANAFNLYSMIGMNLKPISKAMDILNILFVLAIMVVTIVIYMKNRDRLNIILMSAFTMIASSTLAVRGSIEMLALGVVLLFVYAVVANSRRVYALVGGFSILSYINMTLLMSNSGFIGTKNLNLNSLVSFARLDPALIIFSVIAVMMTLYLGYVVYDVCVRDRNYDIAPLEGKLKDDIKTRFELFKANLRAKKQEKSNEE